MCVVVNLLDGEWEWENPYGLEEGAGATGMTIGQISFGKKIQEDYQNQTPYSSVLNHCISIVAILKAELKAVITELELKIRRREEVNVFVIPLWDR